MINDTDERTLFGFSLPKTNRSDTKRPVEPLESFVPPENKDGALVIQDGGSSSAWRYATATVDFEKPLRDEMELIRRYRHMALHHEADMAIDHICNQSIVQNEEEPIVQLNTDGVKGIDEKVKDAIHKEFDKVCRLLDFHNRGYDIFRQWYIDGRLYYHKIIDKKQPEVGLIQLRRIDPMRIKKVQHIVKEPYKGNPHANIVKKTREYFIYNESGAAGQVGTVGVKLDPKSITFVHSGLVDAQHQLVLGHLHKAIKPLNQLRMIEDSALIYRISRAPERRIFYVDTGNMPPAKAEQYVREVMNRFRNRLVYDADTGEVNSDRRHMSMIEDFYVPRAADGKSTQVDTLPGAQNLGEIEDMLYFQKKFWKSLNIPVTRMEPEAGATLGRATEITRDELNFDKFIRRLQGRFSHLFDDLLGTQLILKGILTKKEWRQVREGLRYNFAQDSYYTEAKKTEILRERYSLARDAMEFAGKLFSIEYIRRNILQMTDEEIAKEDKQIETEKDAGMHGEDNSGFG